MRQPAGDHAGDLGGMESRIDLFRIGPDGAQQVARGLAGARHLGIAREIGQFDPVALAVGEEVVPAPVARGVHVELERAADVADHQERRDRVIARQVFGVILRLLVRIAHQLVVARARGGLRGAGDQVEVALARIALLDVALLGLHDEVAALIKVDRSGALERAERTAGHRAFVFVGAQLAGGGASRRGDPESLAELPDEHREVGPLAPAGLAPPFGDELVDRHASPSAARSSARSLARKAGAFALSYTRGIWLNLGDALWQFPSASCFRFAARRGAGGKSHTGAALFAAKATPGPAGRPRQKGESHTVFDPRSASTPGVAFSPSVRPCGSSLPARRSPPGGRRG